MWKRAMNTGTKGAPLSEVRQSIARAYATQARFVRSDRDGADAVEVSTQDAAGSHVLGTVRIVRAPSGVGWPQATANTCDDY